MLDSAKFPGSRYLLEKGERKLWHLNIFHYKISSVTISQKQPQAKSVSTFIKKPSTFNLKAFPTV